MYTVRNALRRAAITRWSLLVSAGVLLLGALPPLPEAPDFTILPRLAAQLATVTSAIGLLVIARLVWLRPGTDAPFVAIATFGAAGAVSAGVRRLASAPLGGQLAGGLPWRIAAMAVAAALWLTLLAVAVDFIRSHRQTMASLNAQEASLTEMEDRERDLLEKSRAAMLQPAEQLIRRIRTGLEALGEASPTAVGASDIRTAVDTALRPLSHQLLADDPDLGPGPATITSGRSWTRRAIASACRRVTHSPALVAALPVVLFPLVMGPRWGYLFMVVNAAVSFVVLYVGLRALRVVGEPVLARMPVVVAGLALIAGYAIVSGASLSVTAMLEAGLATAGASGPAGYAFAIGVFVVIFLVASVVETTATQLRDDENRLRTVVGRLAWLVARLRQQVRPRRCCSARCRADWSRSPAASKRYRRMPTPMCDAQRSTMPRLDWAT